MRPKPDRILDYREYPVLCVDDERENLRIFELSFRREFSIVTASNADEALEIINQHPVAIVLSDQRMPGMSGTDFLARVAQIDPKTIRVLVTAYGDVGTLESAINSGSIYRFVAKPWTPEEMRLTIRRGIEVYALDRERDQLVRELTLLNHVSRSISQELDTDSLLKILSSTITEEFGYDSAGVLVMERGRSRLRWRCLDSADREVVRKLEEIEISARSAPRFFNSLSSGEIQAMSALEIEQYEPVIKQWLTEVAAEDTLVVPMCGRSGLEGALVVDNRRGGSSFSSDDCTLLEGLANQAVIAIENARLVEDLRRSREQVMRSERLGTLGTLAAGLAHEINNPLVSIRTFLSMAPGKRRVADDEFWVDYHALAFEEVERIGRLVETMQRLGRDSVAKVGRELLDLEALSSQVVTLVQREAASKNVSIHQEVCSGLTKYVGVRDQIHQLFLNLLLNAIYAAREDGDVFIRIEEGASSGSVVLEVRDDGEGISDEDIERIFDPFFTTKGPDEGTGLGLMICHGIVSEHGGAIEVDSRLGGGAVFRVVLPYFGAAERQLQIGIERL
jgi:signal transduction histidine kinase